MEIDYVHQRMWNITATSVHFVDGKINRKRFTVWSLDCIVRISDGQLIAIRHRF